MGELLLFGLLVGAAIAIIGTVRICFTLVLVGSVIAFKLGYEAWNGQGTCSGFCGVFTPMQGLIFMVTSVVSVICLAALTYFVIKRKREK
ncbi:hypothetical protein DFO55_12452 [Grimontella sp. AG753]|nr:hypothetical protein DFO55_12452 [Grimontella sp. AG753]